MLLQKKLFWNFQELFATSMESISKKRIIFKTDEFALKKNSAKIAFLCCDINQFKTLKVSTPWK